MSSSVCLERTLFTNKLLKTFIIMSKFLMNLQILFRCTSSGTKLALKSFWCLLNYPFANFYMLFHSTLVSSFVRTRWATKILLVQMFVHFVLFNLIGVSCHKGAHAAGEVAHLPVICHVTFA